MAVVRTISLWQPWASMVVQGFKRFETRHWDTEYRGPLLIHAAKTKRWQLKTMCESSKDISNAMALMGFTFDDLPRGGIIGKVELANTLSTSDAEIRAYIQDNPLERSYGNFDIGRFAWKLKCPSCFPELVPCIGRQGFFNAEEP